MSTAIHWFRRDLRLTDNSALNAAVAAHDHVVPAYIVSRWTRPHRWTGAARQEFLCGSLAALEKNLEHKGGRLVIRQGDADVELEKLARETGATAIYFNRDPDPFGREMERRIAEMAARCGLSVHAHQDHALHERDEVLTGSGTPFKVFTPYARAWSKLSHPAPGRTLARISTPPVESLPLPTLATWGLTSSAKIVEPGEAAARRRLGRFLDGMVHDYAARRDLPGDDATSRISQDLRYGLLSVREVFSKVRAIADAQPPGARRGAETWINELIWREFYFQVLWHWPHVLEHEFNENLRGLDWREPGENLQRWQLGQTGFPIVDAGMRELAATGFMHNRVRMIVAMFLSKDLHLWWQHGESWFMRHLVDGEIASNNGGWQWSAGTGTDAAPYFRIQNPWTQIKRYDPEARYIRRWVPELRDVPAARLAEPPAPGLSLARGYPVPVVDHSTARDEALRIYKRL